MSTDTATHITQVGTIIVPVSDQDAAIAFYSEKLGFEKRSDTPFGRGDRWVEVGPAGHTTTIALMPPQEGEAVGISTRVAFSTSDIDADHADLRSRGVDVDAEVMRMGGPVPPMFWFRDQDKNSYLLVQSS
ncbi:MAG TPA: VOC family protein [Solirubrobacteraceae bacterium]|nr:VOC family protein [Solirubrobacteraceae bacterium]